MHAAIAQKFLASKLVASWKVGGVPSVPGKRAAGGGIIKARPAIIKMFGSCAKADGEILLIYIYVRYVYAAESYVLYVYIYAWLH